MLDTTWDPYKSLKGFQDLLRYRFEVNVSIRLSEHKDISMSNISLQLMTYKFYTKVRTFYKPTSSQSHNIINVILSEMKTQTLVRKIKYLMKHEKKYHRDH